MNEPFPITFRRLHFGYDFSISPNPYPEESGCDYGGENPTDVYPNHYGSSELRTKLKELETNTAYFSASEQDLMAATTITTEDTKNTTTYTTTDKLYAAYGDYYDDQYITVGTNAADNLNGGLRIELLSDPYTSFRCNTYRLAYKTQENRQTLVRIRKYLLAAQLEKSGRAVFYFT